MTCSPELADLIYGFCERRAQGNQSLLALAQRAYLRIDAFAPAVVCMLRQGRVRQAVEQARRSGLGYPDLAEILSQCPSLELAHSLLSGSHSLLPLGVILDTLIQDRRDDMAVQLILDLHQATSHGTV